MTRKTVPAWDLRQLVVENPAALRDALHGADCATLLMVLVHLTGDRELLSAASPFITGPMSYQEKMPDEMRADIRGRLFDILSDYALNDRAWPQLPEGDLLIDLLSTAAGTRVADDYVEMMRDDFDPEHSPPDELGRRYAQAAMPDTDIDVLVIGAGMSGIAAGIYLQAAGVPFLIVEKDDAFGGTWHQNVYPGCGVDTPNHFYSYSFEPDNQWTSLFAKRDELWGYFERVADRHDLRTRTRFGTEVLSAAFDEASDRWLVHLRGPDGTVSAHSARIVISAVGLLNRPMWPDIPGLETFAGTAMHSASWDRTFDWRGKRVAVVGTGASAHQIIPTIAPDAERLGVFQRSPHWVVPNPNYFLDVSPAKKWAIDHIPYYARWYRFQLFWGFADGLHDSLKIDPSWPEQDRSINASNDRHRRFMERFIRTELGDDSPLLPKVIPSYPPYGKRILIDNHWYRTLARENVDLVTEPIRAIRPEGIELTDGSVWECDAIVFATGFQASKVLAPLEIVGRRGIAIHSVWRADDATAYSGAMVPGFPNFFTLLGPNTGLAHGGNAIFVVECQMRFVMECLTAMAAEGKTAVEVTQEAHDRQVAEVDDLHAGMVWSHGGVKNWYRNPAGRVFAIMPYRLVDFWKMTATVDRTAVNFS